MRIDIDICVYIYICTCHIYICTYTCIDIYVYMLTDIAVIVSHVLQIYHITISVTTEASNSTFEEPPAKPDLTKEPEQLC